jgi:hypothetical protein
MPNDVIIHIKGSDEASGVLNQVEKKAGGLGSALGKVGTIAGGIVMSQGVMAAPGMLMDATQAAADHEAAEIRLKTAIENTGTSYDAIKGQIDATIDKGKAAGFSYQDQADALALLTAQTGSAEEAQKRMGMAADLARGAHVDLYTASKLLGKATDENVNVLSRYGISIEKGAGEAELFGKIQEKFGGQADAFAASSAGQMEAAKIQMHDLQVQIGTALLPVMTALVGVLTKDIIPAIQNMAAVVGPVLSGAFNVAKAAIEPVISFLSDHKEVLVALGVAIAMVVTPAIAAWTVAEIAHAAALLATGAAFLIAYAPVVAITAAIALLVLGIIEIVKHWDDIWPKIKAVWDTVLGFFTDIVGPFFTDTIPGFFISLKDKVVGIITDAMDWLKENWQTIVTVALGILFPPAGGLFFIVTHFEEVKAKVGEIIGDIISFIEALPGRVLGFLGDWANAGTSLAGALVTAIKDAIGGLVGAIGGFVGDIKDAFLNLIKGGWNAMIDWADANLHISVGKTIFGKYVGIDWNPDLSIFKLAEGIRGFSGGLALVGERGPELVALPSGADVYSNRESREMFGGTTIYNYGRVTNVFPNADARIALRETDRLFRGV